MPELPEVETVVRGLRASLPGRLITGVHFGKTDFVEDPATIAEHSTGSRVSDVTRLGKFICVTLETSPPNNASATAYCLIIHLGMTGQLTLAQSGDPVPPHTHCFFHLDDGRELRYTDIRRFGRMLLVPKSGLGTFTGKLGKEPLEIGEEEFCSDLGSRRARVKALLLDQRVLRGIGNIYADESLFRARLHPARIAGGLAKKQLLALYRAMREVLAEAIQFRGSSVSDYVDAEGRRGEFQFQHRVYQREGKPCLVCKAKIRRIIVAGRSSHFCPRCQPSPRAKSLRAKKPQHRAKRSRTRRGKLNPRQRRSHAERA
jgi:formamidopyrimidine-DNA glycosylase